MEDIFSKAFGRHEEVVKESIKSILPEVRRAGEMLLEAVTSGHRLLVCGNGGSAADSQHFAAEFVCKYKESRQPLGAMALSTDTSALTAIGNDYGFEEIFKRQVGALGRQDDVLVAITTSGRSPNVLRAMEEAKKHGLKVVVLTGEKGKDLEKDVDVVIAVPSVETARIQEVHEVIYHAWCEYVDHGLQNSS